MGELIIRDGQDGTIGATTDAAVTTDIAATISARLRGMVNILVSVWDSVNGRVKVDGSGVQQPVSIAKPTLTTGTLSTTGDVVKIPLDQAHSVTFAVLGTYTGLALIYEASFDDVNWLPVVAQRVDSPNPRITTLSATATNIQAFATVGGFRYFRIRATAISSGSASVTIAPTMVPYPLTTDEVGSAFSITGNANYGYSSHHNLISAATTNATSVKASAGAIGAIILSNTSGTMSYFKLYNKASAPTVGTDTPIAVYAVPPNTTIIIAMAAASQRLTTGIAYAITANAVYTDTTAIGAGDLIVNISYA